ncbi:MAG: nicotinate-nucleotide adenylyltransferase [Myxococcota bacterium]
MSLGVFGGSFNPIHFAHLRLAEQARETLGLERVLFVPSASPPHKSADLAPARRRLEMVAIAIATNPCFEVLDLELERGGPSYTVDTLRLLSERHRGACLWFLLGSDSLAELDTWRDPEGILELCSLAVAGRPGTARAPLESLLPASLARQFRRTPRGLEHTSGQEIRAVPFGPQAISASDIRERAARSASLRYLVPDGVIDYIVKHRLYAPRQEEA